jgi:hypothetical protein
MRIDLKNLRYEKCVGHWSDWADRLRTHDGIEEEIWR